MKIEEVEVIDKLAAVCRARGVRVVDIPGSIRLEFAEPDSGAKQPLVQTLKGVEPTNCKCGHPEHAHMNGGCILGCDPSECTPQEKAA